MSFVFSPREVKEILVSSVILSIAFALAFSDGLVNVFDNIEEFPTMVLFSFVAVGVGFLAHELVGHKLFAQRFGLHAEYKMWNFGLVVALLSSAMGFVFAAPGAVYIGERLDLWGKKISATKRRMGITSVMGPVVNLLIAAAFFALNSIYQHPMFILGISINVWLAFFNMLPIPPLDGSKVLWWDKRVFAVVFAATLGLSLLFVF